MSTVSPIEIESAMTIPPDSRHERNNGPLLPLQGTYYFILLHTMKGAAERIEEHIQLSRITGSGSRYPHGEYCDLHAILIDSAKVTQRWIDEVRRALDAVCVTVVDEYQAIRIQT